MQSKTILLKIVRQTIVCAFSNKNYRMQKSIRDSLSEKKGVFVSINKNGKLRGSFGYPPGIMCLADALKQAARGAAFKDPRFPNLKSNELQESKFEIILIGDLVPLKNKIPKGKGLYITYGPYKAMQLPTPKLSDKAYIERTMHSAGIAPEMIHSPNLSIYYFTFQRFSEQ